MANTYSQIYIQVVFAVKYRQALIQPAFEEDLYRYITGIVRGQKQKLIAINGMPDHIHAFLSLRPDCRLSDLVREMKSESSTFVNERKLTKPKFHWQEGYGAFSYSRSQQDSVVRYVMNQKTHHRKRTFREEYMELLKRFEIEYKPEYLFEFFD